MKKIYLLYALMFLPGVALAGTTSNITDVFTLVGNVVNGLFPVVIGIAGLIFVFGIIKYVVAKDPEKQKEARGVIVWGVIVLFVVLTFWGLVNILVNTAALETGVPKPPALIPIAD